MPVQMEEIRRDVFAALETKASKLREVGMTRVLPPMITVSNRPLLKAAVSRLVPEADGTGMPSSDSIWMS